MAPSAQELRAKARKNTGLDDFGDEWFMGPLNAYLKDLGSPYLSEWGRAFLARLAVRNLERKLQVVDCLKQNPEIENTPIPPIAYITGHERSGTTMLHNLLSLHDKARFLSRWELMAPTPPPDAATLTNDPRKAVVQESVDALRGTDLERMHWVNADEPDECPWGFMDCTGLLGMAPSLILPHWAAWMNSNDMTPTFVNYRKIVQILTWKNPVPEGGFLVLKAPQMASYLPAFSSVFPEATFIYIHRDPYRVLRSFYTLIEIVDGPFLENRNHILELEQSDSTCLNRMGRLFNDLGAFEDAQPQKVVNSHYSRLLENPVHEIPGIFNALGIPEDLGLGDKIERYLQQQKAGGRAKARAQMSELIYTGEQVRNYPPIASYLERYGVAQETRRQTGE